MAKIGLNVNEVEILTSPQMRPSNVNNVGILVDSRLGPINEVVEVGSIADYQLKFGKVDPTKYSYYVLKGLFDNIGNNTVSVKCLRAIGTTTGTASFHTVGTSANTVTYSRGYYGKSSPGVAGDSFKVEVVASGAGFILNVYETVYSIDYLVETIYDLKTTNFETKINSDSKYIKCVKSGDGVITALVKTALSGGVDPVVATVSERSTLLSSFDQHSIQYVFDAENTDTTTASNIEAYCANRNTVTGIWSLPYAANATNAKETYTATLLKFKSFLVGLFNWVKVDSLDEGTNPLWVPAVGHYFGCYYVRKRAEKGNFAHIPPAGPAYSLRGILEIQHKSVSETELSSLVKDAGVNVVQFLAGYGFVVRTSRTFSTDNKWYSIHRRASQNYIIETSMANMRFAEQEPNTSLSRSILKGSMDMFLGNEYQNGMFGTDGGYDNNVRVTCDSSNNTPQDVANRILNLLTQVHYMELAETINIAISSRDSAFNVTES